MVDLRREIEVSSPVLAETKVPRDSDWEFWDASSPIRYWRNTDAKLTVDDKKAQTEKVSFAISIQRICSRAGNFQTALPLRKRDCTRVRNRFGSASFLASAN